MHVKQLLAPSVRALSQRTETIQPPASDNDCHVFHGIGAQLGNDGIQLDALVQSVGKIGTTFLIGGGMRFPNILIKRGATVVSAYLTLNCRPGASATVVRSRISAEDVDDAVVFANNVVAFDARWAARTTARVAWDAIPAWTANVDYNSPDIAAVIQEIVNRAGWVPGNAIVIFWDDFDARTTGVGDIRRYGKSYDRDPAEAPELVITYMD